MIIKKKIKHGFVFLFRFIPLPLWPCAKDYNFFFIKDDVQNFYPFTVTFNVAKTIFHFCFSIMLTILEKINIVNGKFTETEDFFYKRTDNKSVLTERYDVNV